LLYTLGGWLRAPHVEIEFTDEAVEMLSREGFDPEYGARPLRRTIQRLVENELSRMLLSGDVEPGDRVTVHVAEGDLHFEVERGAASEEVTAWSEEAEEAQTPENIPAR
jgi:ATP-dependent Clp protease ATP-binding subunit ClpC